MSRVRDQEARAEQQRLQKKADTQAKQNKTSAQQKQRFQGMLKTQKGAEQQARAQQTAGQQQEAKEQLQGQNQANAQEAARNARLARGGMLRQGRVMEQAQSFHAKLDEKRGDVEKQQQTDHADRSEGMQNAREASSERAADVEQKKEERQEIAKAQARADATKGKAKPNAAIDGDTKKGDGDGKNDEAGVDLAKKAGGKTQGPEAAQQAGYTRGAQKIPEEILDKLVNQVFVGVDAKGLKMMRIELKDGALKGCSLSVKADGGKISLSFGGLDDGTKRLMDASRGDLMRKLEKKGLALDDLRFTD